MPAHKKSEATKTYTLERITRDKANLTTMNGKVIALEDYDFVYTAAEMQRIVELWQSNVGIEAMTKEMQRPTAEIFILLIEAAERDLLCVRNICFFDGRICRR